MRIERWPWMPAIVAAVGSVALVASSPTQGANQTAPPAQPVWINEVQVSDATDTENHALNGMVEGPIAIQIHGGGARWQPGGFWRWRNIGVRELRK